MNKTEAARAASLRLLQLAGEVVDFDFEPVKFRMADKTWYTPDFFIQYPSGLMVAEDVKGRKKDGDRYVEYWEEDAKIKHKTCAELHSWAIFRSARPGGPGEPEWVVSYAFPEDAEPGALLSLPDPGLGSLAGAPGPGGRRESEGGLDVPEVPAGLIHRAGEEGPFGPGPACDHGVPYRWSCEKCDEKYLTDPEEGQTKGRV